MAHLAFIRVIVLSMNVSRYVHFVQLCNILILLFLCFDTHQKVVLFREKPKMSQYTLKVLYLRVGF